MEKLKLQSIKGTEGRPIDLKQFSIARAMIKKDSKWEIVYMNDYGDLVLSRILVGKELENHQKEGFMSNYEEFCLDVFTKDIVYEREPSCDQLS